MNKLLDKKIIENWPSFSCYTAKKMKFSIKDFFSKCDQIHSFLRIWSHLLKKSLIENSIFCAVLLHFEFEKLWQEVHLEVTGLLFLFKVGWMSFSYTDLIWIYKLSWISLV